MKVVEGDIVQLALQGEFDIIVHGCNCFCTMGSGVARAIREAFPEAYEADCKTVKGDKGKLGKISKVTVERNGHDITIVNAYTQYRYGRDGKQYLDYDALKLAMREVAAIATVPKLTIGYPMIGAGLAGGDWKLILEIIDSELDGYYYQTLVKFPSHDP